MRITRAEARKLLALPEFAQSELTPMQRAELLCREHGCCRAVAADVCGVSRTSLFRWMKACEAGRAPGKVGRPRKLTTAQEDTLAEKFGGRLAEASPNTIAFEAEQLFPATETVSETWAARFKQRKRAKQ